ncbi:hypothetical protein BGZ76_007356 [Entomortierella beljakovae]|nr:hypothetical protein BGZ76_007356 [Entomortierella beljakovae]
MGDGIINQSMREDMECWIEAIGLSYDTPLNVVGFFGNCRDLSIFEHVYPDSDNQNYGMEGAFSSGYQYESRGPFSMGYEGHHDELKTQWPMGIGRTRNTGDINVYIDRSKNTLMLQHAFLHDTQDILSVCLESNEVVSKDVRD